MKPGPSAEPHGHSKGRDLKAPADWREIECGSTFARILQGPAYRGSGIRAALLAGVALLGALAGLPGSAAGAVTTSEGSVKAAPGAVTGREVRARCWQGGAKVVELNGFAAAELGRQSRDDVLLLRGRDGRTVMLVPLGYGLCSIEVDK
jgi:hypothetical protein